MLRPTSATIACSAESRSNMFYIRFPYPSGSVWSGCCSETQMIPTQSSSPSPYFLLVNIFPECTFQVFFPGFASHLYTLSQWHPASFPRAGKGCSQEGAAASHPEGRGLRAPLPSAAKTTYPFPTQLSLFKDANTPEDEREGMGIVKIWILSNSLSQRVFHLSNVHTYSCARLSTSQVLKECSSCSKRHTNIIYNFPPKISTLNQSISVFPMPCFPQSTMKPYTKFSPNFRDKIGSLWARSIM